MDKVHCAERARANLSDIAKKLQINDRTLRWHHSKHVLPLINSYYVHRLSAQSKELKKTLGLIYEFHLLKRATFAAVRRIFNNFPFTWNESGRKDGYYRVVLTIPTEHFIESSRFLATELQTHLNSWVTHTLDLTTGQWYTIPYENFDDKAGWFFDDRKAMQVVLASLPRKK